MKILICFSEQMNEVKDELDHNVADFKKEKDRADDYEVGVLRERGRIK